MQKYPYFLQTRVSASERDIIRNNAAWAGLSVCAYLRERAVKRHVRSAVEVASVEARIAIQNAINKVGAMVKIMMREGRQDSDAIMTALLDIKAMIEAESDVTDGGDENQAVAK